MLAAFLAISALIPSICAFFDTVPLVAWSSNKQTSLLDYQKQDRLPSIETILNRNEICDFDAVVILDQPELSVRDLKLMSPSSTIPLHVQHSPKSMQIPYSSPLSTNGMYALVDELAQRCAARAEWHDLESVDDLDRPEKRIVYVRLPISVGDSPWQYDVEEFEKRLDGTLKKVEDTFSNYFIIYTGSFTSDLSRRQTYEEPSDIPFSFEVASSNETLSKDAGLLHRYQLLTPGLIVSLLIAFFLILPIVLIAIKALAGVQSSVRLNAPKAMSQERKDQ